MDKLNLEQKINTSDEKTDALKEQTQMHPRQKKMPLYIFNINKWTEYLRKAI